MSKSTEFDVKLFSPRWGHQDNYRFIANEKLLVIKCPHDIQCKWIENRDPEWSGYGTVGHHPLEAVLHNDHIYPPIVFADAIEGVWIDWRNGELNDSQFAEETENLFKWVNIVTNSKPNTDYLNTKI